MSGGRSELETKGRVGESKKEKKKRGGGGGVGGVAEWPFPSLSDTTPLLSSKAMQK